MSSDNPIQWYRQFWPRPLREDVAVRLAEGWASDQRSPVVVLEARSTAGQVSYLLGSPASDVSVVRSSLLGLCPDIQLVPEPRPNHPADAQPPARPTAQLGASLRASTRHRALKGDDLPGRSRAVLAALSRTGKDEHLVLQLVLGPRRVPLAVPNQSPSSIVMPWWQTAWYGNRGQVDPEKRAALRTKVAEHGFACSVRIGARAATPRRREHLVLGVLAAMRGGETPGLRLRLTREPARRIDDVFQPWRWPLRLGVHELLAIAGWPISGTNDDDLPGLPAAHPAPLPPSRPTATRAKTDLDSDRVLAVSAAPGTSVPLVLPIADQLRHLHAIGPTGVGKSTMLAHLALADIAAGRGLVVIDPKGDLVDDILARVPDHRRDDIVVLDPADRDRPVGFNPLATNGNRAAAELAADGLLAVFHQLWADSWGPRTQDILHACLLTLTRRGDASLVMLPLLLTNPGFRRSLVQQAIREDPLALGPFWAWYEHLSDGERAAVIAPVMNKLRAFLLRPTMRAVLGQVTPVFRLRQVFLERKVLLVSLSKGALRNQPGSVWSDPCRLLILPDEAVVEK
ncbi:type IV secretory system conjugative DNA transfer family protein [Nakamurella multipartita]|uniref:type IV secretory system conjugative DNA transfer family protein n=1 Tax=Nakamurella multipartita TaxID=53461 RepID=UPI00019E8B92|nr:type IV secretion system DNA-binding domain-containing protein [Nakamurella multipartita]